MPKIKRKIVKNESLLFNDFVVEKETNGLAKKSIENYIKVYERYCKEIGEDISKESVLKWIKFLINKGLDFISINFYIVQLRVFAYWLMKYGYLEKFEIKKLKVQEPQVKTICDEDIIKLLERPNINSPFIKYRSWAIINFILGTGSRASTVMNMMVEDIDFIGKEIRYRHLKNKSIAIVPLSSSLEKILKQYLTTWDLGNGFLFPDRFGGQLTLNALEQSLRNYCKDRGVKFSGAHVFRHTFAKKYIMNGGNAFALQRLLTHTDLTMTKKYVHLFSEDLKNGYEDICPLDSYKKQPAVIRRKMN